MFDSKDELIQKIRLGEDSLLELKGVRLSGTKVAGPGRDELADELAAFANSKDGVVVLGVDDKKREVEGIPIDKLDAVETFIRDLCNDSIKPPLLARIIRMEIPDAAGTMKAILKIDVPKSLFVHKSPGGYFTRLGSSKRELVPDMLARLFQQRSQARLIRFEEQAVPETSIKDLSEKLWRRFAGRSAESDEIVLEKRGLLVREESGALRASVVGVLMASENPEKFLSGATIEAVRYRGGVPDSN